MTLSVRWAFVEGASISEQDDGGLMLRAPTGETPLRLSSPGVRAAMLALGGDGAPDAELSRLVVAADGDARLPVLYALLARLTRLMLLRRIVCADGAAVATAVPTSRWGGFREVMAQPETPYVLSRFAYLHREGGQLVLESSLSHAKVLLHGWQATALAGELARPGSAAALSLRIGGVSEELATAVIELLLSVGLVSATDETGATAEESNTTLRQWEFHDLLFHTRSRLGRLTGAYGGTFRFHDAIPPLPALKPPVSAEFVELYRPDIEALRRADVPFTAVMEDRASIRETGERPISAAELGEFLYRAARVKSQVASDSGEYAFRVYPGGGGEYELELYLSISACEGIAPGLYHYAPGEHRLYRVSELTDLVQALLGNAAAAGVRESFPQVLITVAARFQRVSWKYQSIAYTIILKDVGVLYQTMYLVATAMGLAPCALGGGDADLFAAAAKTDYYAETSVGEFMLGSRPRQSAAAPAGAELADVPRARWG